MTLAKTKKLNNDRRFTGGGPRPDHTKANREEADERAKFWNKLSTKEKLNELDRRLGVNVGAKKQRARLMTAQAPKVVPVIASENVTSDDNNKRIKAKDRRAAERQERPTK
jgi:hypothetical protein